MLAGQFTGAVDLVLAGGGKVVVGVDLVGMEITDGMDEVGGRLRGVIYYIVCND